MRKNPEAYFPEIAGEDTPSARNPLLQDEHYLKRRTLRRQIKRDQQWLLAVSNTMANENLTLEQAIDREAERVLQGLPSLRDKTVSAAEYREILIKQMIQRIMYEPEWIQSLEKQAAEKGVPIDEWVYRNAAYMVDQDIQSGKIILPQNNDSSKSNP